MGKYTVGWDDDFYDEPSEFEEQIDEFKQGLISAVKDEFKAELERLSRENAELQSIKIRMREIEREHKSTLNAIENDRRNLEATIKLQRLTELLPDNFLQGWCVAAKHEEKPKCEHCDENRRLEYKTPRGREQQEQCECAEKLVTYFLEPAELYKFTQHEYCYGGETTPGIHVYFEHKTRDRNDEFTRENSIFAGEAFKDINRYHVVFLDKAKCQEYCDWLNNRQREDDNA